jgi:hypothetical protein
VLSQSSKASDQGLGIDAKILIRALIAFLWMFCRLHQNFDRKGEHCKSSNHNLKDLMLEIVATNPNKVQTPEQGMFAPNRATH